MYLRTSKYKLERKKGKRFNLPLIAFICLLIIGATYFQAYVVPVIPPPFLPTALPTRSASSYASDAAQLFNEGKLQKSIETYEQAILLNPTDSDLYIALSRVQIFAHDYNGALENAQNAVLGSKSAMSYAVYGEALYKLDKLVEAEKKLRKSLDLDPRLALTDAYLAEVLIDSDWANWKTASDTAHAAITLDPSLMESHRAMGYVYQSTANYQEALVEYQKAIDIHDKLADLWIALGDCYHALTEPQKAIDSYLNASAFSPQDPVPFARISREWAGEGQFGKAKQYAEMARDVAPLDPMYHGLVGVMYYFDRDYQGAIIELSLAIFGGRVDAGTVQGLPLSAGRVEEYYWTYGLALAKVGRCSEAVPIFRMLQQQFPDDTEAMGNVTDGLLLCNEITPTPGPKA
jgi:tetratricopeptide (TPR) repeat protein